MLYALLRAVAGIALRWFYRRIDVEGLERLPRTGPTLLVVNHPNALVDAMLVGWAIPRRVVLTAKAPLFQHWFLARLLHSVGVVPLVRSSDVRGAEVRQAPDPQRNARSFGALRSVLRHGGAVMIFPEGTTHDLPSLAPLRTGAARIALDARDEAEVRGLQIVPIGLTFERKESPRTRVLVQVGEVIDVDAWTYDGDSPATKLTEEIDEKLRAVTLNYATDSDAVRVRALATLLAASAESEVSPVGHTRSLRVDVAAARRIEQARLALSRTSDSQLRERADSLVNALAEYQDALARHRVALEDLSLSSEGRFAAPFVLREAWIIGLGGPVALWGIINHWIPFHAARIIARRSVESAADPAMRTIVAGAALVLAFYLAQGVAVGLLFGGLVALLYVASLPLAADVNFVLRERLSAALRRARTYFLFRRRPKLQERLQSDLQRLRAEALEIELLLGEREAMTSTR